MRYRFTVIDIFEELNAVQLQPRACGNESAQRAMVFETGVHHTAFCGEELGIHLEAVGRPGDVSTLVARVRRDIGMRAGMEHRHGYQKSGYQQPEGSFE